MGQVGGYLKVCHLNEKTYYAVRLCNSDHYVSRSPRITYSTYRAMKKRGWFEFSKKTHTGGRLGTLPDGTIGMVEQYFDMHYVLSEKARKTLQKISSKKVD